MTTYHILGQSVIANYINYVTMQDKIKIIIGVTGIINIIITSIGVTNIWQTYPILPGQETIQVPDTKHCSLKSNISLTSKYQFNSIVVILSWMIHIKSSEWLQVLNWAQTSQLFTIRELEDWQVNKKLYRNKLIYYAIFLANSYQNLFGEPTETKRPLSKKVIKAVAPEPRSRKPKPLPG